MEIQLPIACELSHFSEGSQNASYNLNIHIDENLYQSSQIRLMKSQNQHTTPSPVHP